MAWQEQRPRGADAQVLPGKTSVLQRGWHAYGKRWYKGIVKGQSEGTLRSASPRFLSDSDVAFGKLLNFTDPQFLHLYNGQNNTFHPEML